MPKQGFKSITLHDEFVERMVTFIKHNRGKSIPSHINSPAELLEYYEEKLRLEKKHLTSIANKIQKVPTTFIKYS